MDDKRGYMITKPMNEYNNPITFRPSDQDRTILDAVKTQLALLTKQEAFDTAAIRYALRYWSERQTKEE